MRGLRARRFATGLPCRARCAVSALRAGIPRASAPSGRCALRLPGGSLRSPPQRRASLSQPVRAPAPSPPATRLAPPLAPPIRTAVRSRAAAAPLRRVRRRRSSHPECRLPVLSSTPEAARFSHPTHLGCPQLQARAWPVSHAVTTTWNASALMGRVDALEHTRGFLLVPRACAMTYADSIRLA